MKTEDLEFHVLVCVASAPDGRHGYGVRRWLKERLNMDVPLQSIYRTVQRLHKAHVVDLQERGFAGSLAGLPRKTFKLTDFGKQYAAARTTVVQTQVERLQLSIGIFAKATSHGRKAEGR
jgi:DNA-binding PadR family transcriptional regulator